MQPEIIEIKRMKKICHILFEEKKNIDELPFSRVYHTKKSNETYSNGSKTKHIWTQKTLSHTRKKKEMMLKKATYIYSKNTHTHNY